MIDTRRHTRTVTPAHAHRPEERSKPCDDPARVHVGIVRDATATRLVVVARTRRDLYGRLASYAGEWARLQLRPGDAAAVYRALEEGDAEAAVNRYFGATDRPWDRETVRITVETVVGV